MPSSWGMLLESFVVSEMRKANGTDGSKRRGGSWRCRPFRQRRGLGWRGVVPRNSGLSGFDRLHFRHNRGVSGTARGPCSNSAISVGCESSGSTGSSRVRPFHLHRLRSTFTRWLRVENGVVFVEMSGGVMEAITTRKVSGHLGCQLHNAFVSISACAQSAPPPCMSGKRHQ